MQNQPSYKIDKSIVFVREKCIVKRNAQKTNSNKIF